MITAFHFIKEQIELCFSILSFVKKKHSYKFLIIFDLFDKFTKITQKRFEFAVVNKIFGKKNKFKSKILFYFSNWSIDRSMFKKIVQKIEICFSNIFQSLNQKKGKFKENIVETISKNTTLESRDTSIEDEIFFEKSVILLFDRSAQSKRRLISYVVFYIFFVSFDFVVSRARISSRISSNIVISKIFVQNSSIKTFIFIVFINKVNNMSQSDEQSGGFEENFDEGVVNFIFQQMIDLAEIVIATITIQLDIKNKRKKRKRFRHFSFEKGLKDHENQKDSFNAHIETNEFLKTFDINFFNSDYDDKNTSIFALINAEKHVFYKNVYAFIDRFKNFAKVHEINKIREIISTCFGKKFLIGYTMKLIESKKNFFFIALIIKGYDRLITRFKKRTTKILQSLQTKQYTLNDIKQNKIFKAYAQFMLQYVKATEMIFIHNQLFICGNNFALEFKLHISKSIFITILNNFLKQLNVKANLGFQLIKQKTNKKFYEQANANEKKYINKPNNDRNSKNERSIFNRIMFNFMNQYSRQNRFYFYKQKIYSNNQKKKIRMQTFVTTSKKKSSKREFKKERKNYNIYDKNKNYQNKSKKQNKNKNKTKIYVINEEFEEKKEELNDENVAYFDPKYEETFEKKIIVNVAIVANFICRRCKIIFPSNNSFHKYIRSFCNKIQISMAKPSLLDMKKFSLIVLFASAFLTLPIDNANIPVFNVTSAVPIMLFEANNRIVIDTSYGFKDYQYITVEVSLSKNKMTESICFDIEARIILANQKFFDKQINDNISIRIMAIFIMIRGLNSIKHSTNKYVITSIYLSDKNKNDNDVKTLFHREIHLMKNFKTNMLLENDIINSKHIDVIIFINIAHVDNCKINIFIVIKARFIYQKGSIHFTKIIIVSSSFHMLISIHSIKFLPKRDYFFESITDSNLSIYVHMIDTKTKFIQIRNKLNKSIKISKNYRLKHVTKFDDVDVFLIFFTNLKKAIELIIHRSKFFHKASGFKKILMICATTITIVISIYFVFSISINLISSIFFVFMIDKFFEIVLSNDVTIHNSTNKIVKIFIILIDEYFDLGKKKDFAKLFEKNGMRIFLKINGEKKIKDKTKIYFLDIKNGKLIDKIFDELHSQKKLFWINVFISFNFFCFVVGRDFDAQRKKKLSGTLKI